MARHIALVLTLLHFDDKRKLLHMVKNGRREYKEMTLLYSHYSSSDFGEGKRLFTWKRLTGNMTLTGVILEYCSACERAQCFYQLLSLVIVSSDEPRELCLLPCRLLCLLSRCQTAK